MTRPVRVLSLYEGFFAGGARVLHTDLISGLHARGAQQHSVLSIASEARIGSPRGSRWRLTRAISTFSARASV